MFHSEVDLYNIFIFDVSATRISTTAIADTLASVAKTTTLPGKGIYINIIIYLILLLYILVVFRLENLNVYIHTCVYTLQ